MKSATGLVWITFWRTASCLVAGLLMAAILTFQTTTPAEARVKSFVMDAETGEILYARRADQRHYPASLTKMMTLYLTFEAIEAGRLKLGDRLKVSRRAAGQTPSKIGLKRGRTIRVRDAILAVAVKSANDAATVLAEALGETEIEFALRMTDTAKSLGMKRTRFRNASGLPNRRQISTARDMAILGQRLMQDFPQHYHFFSARKFRWGKRTYTSHNKLLKNYRGADGLKTGYIRASGFNIATSAKRGDRRLIAVVLGERTSKLRNRKVARLLDVSFRRAATRHTFAAKMAKRKTPPKPKTKPSLIARLADRMGLRSTEEKIKRGKPAPAQTKLSGGSGFLSLPTDAGARPAPAEGQGWWGIQVGAYNRYATAQNRVHRAAGALPKILMHARPSIDLVERKGKEVYRARLVGLRKDDARTACRILKLKSIKCMPVTPEGETTLELAQR